MLPDHSEASGSWCGAVDSAGGRIEGARKLRRRMSVTSEPIMYASRRGNGNGSEHENGTFKPIVTGRRWRGDKSRRQSSDVASRVLVAKVRAIDRAVLDPNVS